MGPANIEVTFCVVAAYVTSTSGGFNDSGSEELVVVMDAAGVDLFGGPAVAVRSLQAEAQGAVTSVTSRKAGSSYVLRVDGSASALAPLTASLPPAAHC
jgi:hypothetical protein